MFFLHPSDVEFWDDRRIIGKHSYVPMKRNQTVLVVNKIKGTRTGGILISYATDQWLLQIPPFPSLPPRLPRKRNTYMPLYSRHSAVSSYFSSFPRYTPGCSDYRMSPNGSGSGSCSSFTQMAEESARNQNS
ncbi:hypothetical protein AVEN_14241-1 [Araneus ventricosus]|uniref:Uncharacterized protein n=1 Tax=Araneus ventricosus TaxID=182803 RepID=A0A4Y2GKE7_ARAVE|nr:hypothetical protein AVEN_14241-1 [Araneus ventricosus]